MYASALLWLLLYHRQPTIASGKVSIAAMGKSASSCESEQIRLNHTHRPGLRLSTNCGVSLKTRSVYFLFDLHCETSFDSQK